ncbi:hypothetical protein I4U23_019811 [Adineta vaga]|nr:hypothetical protein I4U23_019811 [Adineta vaga]
MTNRFQSPHLFWWIIICGGISITFLLAHYPHVIPMNSLGVLGSFLSSLVVNYRLLLILTFWATVIAHAYEALLARHICQQLHIDQISTCLWMIQTFILGFPSLMILKGYVRQR